jgi:class 3 adenylate cyclase
MSWPVLGFGNRGTQPQSTDKFWRFDRVAIKSQCAQLEIKMAALAPIETDSGKIADRRLAAVAFADIVGYTILMESDERRTHQRWMAILSEVIYPRAQKRRGIVVKSTGDGVLVEFPSALDAVEWACEVQRQVRPKQIEHCGTPSTITLRIALHLGDVIPTGFDVFGHGVNVAARLQERCIPGGIILSEAVHDLVRGTIGQNARDLGLLRLKNLEKPIRAYSLDPETGGLARRKRCRGAAPTSPQTLRALAKNVAIAAVMLVLLGGLPVTAPDSARPAASVGESGLCGGGTVTVPWLSRAARPLSAAEECALKPKDSFKECDKCPEMVVVPAGSFIMGTPDGEKERRPAARGDDWEAVRGGEVPHHSRSVRGLRGGNL